MALSFLFLNLGLTEKQLQDVSEIAEKRIALEIEWAKNPISFDKRYDAYFIEEGSYPGFPKRGYSTKEQAETALYLWKMNPNLDDNALYTLSKAILAAAKA